MNSYNFTKAYSIDQIRKFLTKQKDLESAINNLEFLEEKIYYTHTINDKNGIPIIFFSAVKGCTTNNQIKDMIIKHLSINDIIITEELDLNTLLEKYDLKIKKLEN